LKQAETVFMKRVIFLFIYVLCASISSYSQEIEGVATYSIRLAEDNLPFNAELRFTPSASLFFWKQGNTSRFLKKENFKSQIVDTDTLGYYIKRRTDSKKIRIRQFCGENNPVFYDDDVIHDWSLSNKEKKNISGKVCSKATTRFRGRDYVVWYTTEIPVQMGPWKFYGLPGLIMQVEDAKKEIFISLKSLNLVDGFNSSKYDEDIGKYLSKRELIDCLDDEWDKHYKKNRAIIAQLQSEFPELEISDNNLSKKRPATELEFD